MRESGGQFIVFPRTGLWWLQHYEGLQEHLERRYDTVVREEGVCVIFALNGRELVSDPRCSIVIPVHDRAGLTRRCLEAILGDPPRTSFEIVVVDDASADETPALLSRQPDDGALAAPRGERRLRDVACNDGAAAARGELLVFLEQRHGARARAGSTRWSSTPTRIPTRPWSARSCCFPTTRCSTPASSSARTGAHATCTRASRRITRRSSKSRAVPGGDRRVHARAARGVRARGRLRPGFRNSLEDVDLCLRLREAGSEVHYCPGSVVTHLESASRGRGSQNVQHNFNLFQERWADRVQRDDVHYYVEDGLLNLHYRDTYPIGSPRPRSSRRLRPVG